jgi:hypothetical protein
MRDLHELDDRVAAPVERRDCGDGARVGVECGHEHAQMRRTQDVVARQIRDERCGRRVQAHVQRTREAAVVGPAYEPDAGIDQERAKRRGRIVGRRFVDDDQLPRRHVLGEERPDRARQDGSLTVGRHHDRHARELRH